ncbi:MAG: tRNA (adenosine(37)-N6)-threonylcarbamoyltransferase complex dimerization subunit type 1 TsaB [Clostridia bacterium]|nr:tRNA (adenosine(37)-N6)-threonylcarbamoyltransferase complex dimerization subunit type 1 TsaB [Clostridia bacterium]
MKILAMDTTAKTAGLALAEVNADGSVTLLSEYSLKTGSHSTTLLPMIESMLSLHQLTAADIGLYAVSTGPGSFTGVRIGVATVKGLAFLHNTPCIGVSALEAMAMGFERLPGLIFPAMDARRNTVYGAAFISDGEGNVTRLTDDEQIEWTDFADKARAIAENYPDLPFYGCGDGYDIRREEVLDTSAVPAHLAYTTGFGTALAGWRIFAAAEDKSVFTEAALAPVYLKKAQAEREREEMLTRNAAERGE